MKIKNGFVVAAFIAAVVAATAKLFVWWILYDRDTFAITALRLVWKIQIAVDASSLASVILLCLGLLTAKSTKEPVRSRPEDSHNPFDDPEWMRR